MEMRKLPKTPKNKTKSKKCDHPGCLFQSGSKSKYCQRHRKMYRDLKK